MVVRSSARMCHPFSRKNTSMPVEVWRIPSNAMSTGERKSCSEVFWYRARRTSVIPEAS